MKKRATFFRYAITLLGPIATASAGAQTPPADVAQAIPLQTGVVPGSLGPEIWYGTQGNMSVRNTTEAVLLPVLPPPGRATGTAMIVAPGGAFMALAWDQEGMTVARNLADHGIAGFVLKYRVKPTPREWAGFGAAMQAQMKDWIGQPGEGLRVSIPPYAVADGIAAIEMVRRRAAQWQVDPTKVGMIGFSAGARLTLNISLTAPPADRPAFVALLYPPMERVALPVDAPPVFIAMATDDPLSGKAGFGLVQSWIEKGRPVEFHTYQRGGHGFGIGIPATTTTGWMESLFRWIELNGYGAAQR